VVRDIYFKFKSFELKLIAMGTHYKGDQKQVAALDAYIKLTRASESIAARLAAGLGRVGLTTGQLGVLEALLHLGPMCQLDLGKKLLRSAGNVTAVVDNLERRRLVRRRRGTEDRRFVTVELTARGRRCIEEVFPAHAAGIAAAMSELSAAEQKQLGLMCRRLGRAAQAADA
jgi:MarR family transcriptional regulator, 2-MHQ and catechol-resistance regulon repressor